MAEVDRLRALRAELRDVGTPDAARRERAVAAALAAFADEPAARRADGARPAPPPPAPRLVGRRARRGRSPHRRRRRCRRAAWRRRRRRRRRQRRRPGDRRPAHRGGGHRRRRRRRCRRGDSTGRCGDAPPSTESASESADRGHDAPPAPLRRSWPSRDAGAGDTRGARRRTPDAAADRRGSLSVVPVCRLPARSSAARVLRRQAGRGLRRRRRGHRGRRDDLRRRRARRAVALRSRHLHSAGCRATR